MPASSSSTRAEPAQGTPSPHSAVALISGGLGDIGLAVARELSARGIAVALSDVVPENEARTPLENAGFKRWRYDRVDVTDADAVEAWVRRAQTELGPVTIAVPNAGVDMRASLLNITAAQWHRVMSVNLEGVLHLCQSAGRAMVQTGCGGRIVLIGSIAAHLPSVGIPAYCISKAAVRMMTQCLALELAPHRITVNEVAPGNVAGGLSGKVFAQNPHLLDPYRDATPLKTLVPLDDVARAVAFLADTNTQTITGTTLIVDAGWSLLSAAPKESDHAHH